jgi:Flp pilus assembly protein TadB
MPQADASIVAKLKRLFLFVSGVAVLVIGFINPFHVSLLRRAAVIAGGLLAINAATIYYWPIFRKRREQQDREMDELERELDKAERDSK